MKVLYSDEEVMLSEPESPRSNRKSMILIVAVATLVSVIVLRAFMIFSHDKFINHLVEPHEKLNQFNSSVYFFGGVDEEINFLSSGAHFNTLTTQWRNISSLPSAGAKMCGAVSGDSIYLFGGHTGHVWDNLTQSNEAIVYDSSTDTYKSLQPMPEPRGACGAALLDGNIYVAGGSAGIHLKYLSKLSSVVRYNIKSDQWSTVHSMNTPRSVFHLVASDGHLYAIGGRDLETVEKYDPSSDQWSFVASPKMLLSQFSAEVHEGKIYIIDFDNGFEVYSPDDDEWNILSKPDEYRFENLFSVNRKLWAVGRYNGSQNTMNHGEVTKKLFSYDPVTKKWTMEQKLNDTRMGHVTFVVNH